jgi:hypothetical protein
MYINGLLFSYFSRIWSKKKTQIKKILFLNSLAKQFLQGSCKVNE